MTCGRVDITSQMRLGQLMMCGKTYSQAEVDQVTVQQEVWWAPQAVCMFLRPVAHL